MGTKTLTPFTENYIRTVFKTHCWRGHEYDRLHALLCADFGLPIGPGSEVRDQWLALVGTGAAVAVLMDLLNHFPADTLRHHIDTVLDVLRNDNGNHRILYRVMKVLRWLEALDSLEATP